ALHGRRGAGPFENSDGALKATTLPHGEPHRATASSRRARRGANLLFHRGGKPVAAHCANDGGDKTATPASCPQKVERPRVPKPIHRNPRKSAGFPYSATQCSCGFPPASSLAVRPSQSEVSAIGEA